MTLEAPLTAGQAEGLRAYLDAALDCVIMADASGRVVEFNPAAERTFGYTREEALGRTLAELIVPPSLRELHIKAFARFVETREKRVFGRRLEMTGMRADGTELPVELALGQISDEPVLICGAVRDLTEAKRAEGDLRRLADEQAALRRVATLAARESSSLEVLEAVTEEAARVLEVDAIGMIRFEPDQTATLVAQSETPWDPPPLGTRFTLDGENVVASVHRTGQAARVDDWESATGSVAAMANVLGVRSAVASPIIVEGRLWGTMVAATNQSKPLPKDTEPRIVEFTELLATAISNAESREALIVSRARIVAAADEARRRIERNLHDGTQQRLIALGLDVQTLRDSIPADQRDAHSGLERIRNELEAVLEDVRELSHGLHPALLSQAGLKPSLRALARKSPIPVKLDVSVSERPSESTETAVYYVISEALVNAVKHARASEISVVLTTSGSEIRAIIEDDGRGGAEASAGSGLVGLIDRVEALGGRIAIDSPPGHGTRISIEMPLTAEPIDGVARVPRGQSAPGDGPPPQPEVPQPMDEALHAAVAASADALYIVDAHGRIRFLNPAALRTLGYEDERQLLGRPSHDTIHYLRPDGTPFPAAECPLLRPRLNGETVRVEEDWFVRQDGSLVAVSYSSAPVALPDGRWAVVSFREAAQRRPPNEPSIEPGRSAGQRPEGTGDQRWHVGGFDRHSRPRSSESRITRAKGEQMKIVVIGGTGLIGSKLVEKLREDGHDPLAGAPDTGVNTITGEGLAEGLAGAHVVVDVSNAPVTDDVGVMDFFQTSSRNVLDAEVAAGVKHHVLLSIVGADRLKESGYLRAKVAQEEVVKAGTVPYTIVRASQFFEFIGRIADSGSTGEVIHLAPVFVQPESADDVAATLADVAASEPVNRIVELAGPEQFRLDELARRVLSARKDERLVEADVHARYFGAELDEHSLTPNSNARIAPTRFEDWLSRSAARQTHLATERSTS